MDPSWAAAGAGDRVDGSQDGQDGTYVGVKMDDLTEVQIEGIARSMPIKRAQISTVVFDVGGVLASDGLPSTGIDEIFGAVFGAGGYDKAKVDAAGKPLWMQVKVGAITSDTFYKELLQNSDLDAAKATAIHEQHIQYMARWGNDGRSKSIAELLERIQQSGYRLGVISNHVTSWLQEMFAKLGYSPIFYPPAATAATAATTPPVVIVSDAAKSGKPERAVFTSFLQALKQATGQEDAEDAAVAASCVFVDNKQKNIEAAEAAGFHGVLYAAAGQTEAELEAMLTAAGVFIDPVDLAD